MESRWLRAGLRVWVALVLAFLFIPIVLIVLYAFNSSNIESWPISHFSLHWFAVAWHDAQVRSAFLLSVRVGLVATALALLGYILLGAGAIPMGAWADARGPGRVLQIYFFLMAAASLAVAASSTVWPSARYFPWASMAMSKVWPPDTMSVTSGGSSFGSSRNAAYACAS